MTDTRLQPPAATEQQPNSSDECARRTAAAEALLQEFVRLVEPLPQVQLVLSDLTNMEPLIYAIIDVPRSDWHRWRPVYDAELAAALTQPDVPVDFRVTNLGGHSPEEREARIPTDMTVSFKR